MSSAYGETPSKESVREAVENSMSELEQELGEVDVEVNPYDRDHPVLYFTPGLGSNSDEQKAVERILEENMGVDTFNLLYKFEPLGEEARGYEVKIHETV